MKACQNVTMCTKKTQFMCREGFCLTQFINKILLGFLVIVAGPTFQVGQKYL